MADVKKLLGNIALPDYSRLVYWLDSEAEGIKIENKNDHRVFAVRHDSETIVLDSEGNLHIPIDYQTIYIDSEGFMVATGLTVSEGEAIRIDREVIDGVPQATINVLYDSESIVLDSEGRLMVPFDKATIIFDSEGLVKANIDEKTLIFENDVIETRIGGWREDPVDTEFFAVNEAAPAPVVVIEGISAKPEPGDSVTVDYSLESLGVPASGSVTFTMADDGDWLVGEDAGADIYIDAVRIKKDFTEAQLVLDPARAAAISNLVATAHGETYVYHKVKGIYLPTDNKTIYVTDDAAQSLKVIYRVDEERGLEVDSSEERIFVKVDGLTIGFDSEGRLTGTKKLEAVLPVYITSEGDSEGEQKVKLLYSDALGVDSEGKLFTKVDDFSIVIDSEGRLASALKAGEAIEIVDSEGVPQVNVRRDEHTVHLNELENELELWLDTDKAIDVDSEGQLFVKADEKSVFYNSEGQLEIKVDEDRALEITSEGKVAVKVDDKTIKFDSEGRLVGFPEPLTDGVATHVVYGSPEWDSESINVLYNELAGLLVNSENELEVKVDDVHIFFSSEGKLELHLNEDKALEVDSEGLLAVKVDEDTVRFNSEGQLEAKTIVEGEANHIYDSEGDLKIDVLYDDITIHLNSENELELHLDEEKAITVDSEGKIFIKVDEDTVRFNSEGELEAKTILEGEANHIYDSEGNLKIDVLYDDVTIHLNSENKLELHPDEERAFAVDSEGKLFVKVDGLTIQYNSEGELVAFPEPLHDGIATRVVYGTSEWDSEAIDVLFDEEKGLAVDSENRLFVKVDDLTIKFNSEGELFTIPEPLKDGVATHVVPATTEWDSEAIDVLYNSEAGLRVNSENELEVVLDSEALEFKDGAIRVLFDHETLVLDSEGQLSVSIDNETIRLNSEGQLSADALPKPLIPDAFLHVNSETEEAEWVEAKLNGVSLAGDHNTEEARVIWWGTSEEYAQIVASGELYDYTLYIVNDGGPIVPENKDYEELINKPQINGVTLSGNRSLASLGIQPTISSGVATVLANNKLDLSYLPGVLTVDTSNRLTADTYTTEQIDNMLASLRTVKYAATKPANPSRNTLYYIGSSSPYQIYLYDSYGTEIDLGTSAVQTYSAGAGITINSSNVISADVNTTLTESTSSALPPTSQAVVNYAEHKTNKVTSLASTATNDQYPSAKVVYDTFQTKVGQVAPSDSSLEILSGTTITHKEPSTLGGAGTVGSQTIIPKITYDKFGHIQKTEQVTVYPPTSAGLAGQLWVSDGVEAGVWSSLADLIKVKYQSGSQTASDSTTIVINGPAPDTGYKRLCCVGAFISSNVPDVKWAVTAMSDAQVTIYANGWSGTQTITANTVWLYVREAAV